MVAELSVMIGSLRVMSEEVRDRLIHMLPVARDCGAGALLDLENGNAHLMRLAIDLHGHLQQFGCSVGMAHLTSIRTRKNIR